MNVSKRHSLTILFFGVIFTIFASVGAVSFAQSSEGFITEGVSIDDILIGKSTMDDVINIYGNDYKFITHKKYSYEMNYKNLGISFYTCQADPNKEIFSIHIQSPFKAITAKGIVLGESTLADILRTYGEWNESSSGFEYEKEGVYFHYEEETIENEPEKNEKKSDSENSNKDSENTFIIDAQEVSNFRVGKLNQANNIEINKFENELAETLEQEDKKVEDIKKKVVKRIQLIEKSGLRQCYEKFGN